VLGLACRSHKQVIHLHPSAVAGEFGGQGVSHATTNDAAIFGPGSVRATELKGIKRE
jgi:hypothetical protein